MQSPFKVCDSSNNVLCSSELCAKTSIISNNHRRMNGSLPLLVFYCVFLVHINHINSVFIRGFVNPNYLFVSYHPVNCVAQCCFNASVVNGVSELTTALVLLFKFILQFRLVSLKRFVYNLHIKKLIA